MPEVLANALTLVSVLALGVLVTAQGSRLVFVVTTPLIVLVVVGLIRVRLRLTAQDPPPTRVFCTRSLARRSLSKPSLSSVSLGSQRIVRE